MRLVLLTLPLILSGASFSKTSDTALTAARQVSYYWYAYPYDTYNDENTLAAEEFEMWVYYDAPVNTEPGGGTLVERGYTNKTDPHEFPPVYFLYAHFTPEQLVAGILR